MIIENIRLNSFRNYECLCAEFGPDVNIIIGENAQGKTNLLESIYMLASGKPYRAKYARDAIMFGRDSASVCANFTADGRNQSLEIRLARAGSKNVCLNGRKLRSSAQLSGRITAVLFSPDDLYLIKDTAEVRRRMMDACICQLRPKYAAALTEYNRIYEHKRRILRDFNEKPSLLDTLDDFSHRLISYGAVIIYYRAHFIKKLAEAAGRIHEEFSGYREKLEIQYKTVSTVTNPERPPGEIVPLLTEHWQRLRQAEIDSGKCLSGAHKDDFSIFIDGNPARDFGSQGQMRTAALSIKLAERDIHFYERGEYPILLLDDVLSELDEGRQGFVLNRIGGGQTFITCCEDGQISSRTGGRVLRIKQGAIC